MAVTLSKNNPNTKMQLRNKNKIDAQGNGVYL